MVRGDRATPALLGGATQFLTIIVAGVDAHFDRARAARARIVEELNETIYGERQYVAEDSEGHHWLFSQHVCDVPPADWGAAVASGV